MSDTDIKMSEEISGRHSIEGIPMCEYETGRVVAVFYNKNDISSVIEVINAHEELVEQNKALKALLKEVQAIIESSPAVTDTIWYNDQNTLYDEIYLRLNGDDKCEQLNLLEQAK